MQLLVTTQQRNFVFKKIDEIIHIYKKTLEKADELFESVYSKAVSLAEEFGVEEKCPELRGQQINLNNIPTKAVEEYC